MNYLWEAGKPRRRMHIQKHLADGRPTALALCGIRHQFNRSINAPFGLGRKVCRRCRRKLALLGEEAT